MDYSSTVTVPSASAPGVEFTIARLSLGRRIELSRRIREIGLKSDFLAAGEAIEEQIEAGIAQQQVDRAYLEWGLVGVRGLTIDGCQATPCLLVERGPEDLAREAIAAIRSELHLGEEERKN